MSQSIIKNAQVGQLIEDQGIYMGFVTLQGPTGQKPFAVFAAPEDLKSDDGKKTDFDFEQAGWEVSQRKNWFGHDGRSFYYEGRDVLKEIAGLTTKSFGGEYVGEWILPPPQFLIGGLSEKGKSEVVALFDAKDVGALKGTLTMQGDDDNSAYYVTSKIVRTECVKCVEESGSFFMDCGSAGVVESRLTVADFSIGALREIPHYGSAGYRVYEKPVKMKCRPYRLSALPL